MHRHGLDMFAAWSNDCERGPRWSGQANAWERGQTSSEPAARHKCGKPRRIRQTISHPHQVRRIVHRLHHHELASKVLRTCQSSQARRRRLSLAFCSKCNNARYRYGSCGPSANAPHICRITIEISWARFITMRAFRNHGTVANSCPW
jgi:hypothetical protein